MPPLSGPEHERIEGLAGLSALDERLTEALALLPEDQRRAVQLRVLEERTYAGDRRRDGRLGADGARPRLARPTGARPAAAAIAAATRRGDAMSDPARAAQDALGAQLVEAARDATRPPARAATAGWARGAAVALLVRRACSDVGRRGGARST